MSGKGLECAFPRVLDLRWFYFLWLYQELPVCLCLERSVTETHLGWEDIIDFFQFPPPTFYYGHFKHSEKLIELWIPIRPSPKFYNCYYFAILTLSLFTYLCVYLLGVWFEIFHKFRQLKRKSFSLKKGLNQKRDTKWSSKWGGSQIPVQSLAEWSWKYPYYPEMSCNFWARFLIFI